VNYSFFQRPSRYINSEYNSVGQKNLSGVVKVALAFPDVYEIGMSHLGLKILYKIINDLPYASAERAFSPWTDLEEHMKKNSVPLTSLESQTPLINFDIVGFSLQYELAYTTVLNMLSLAGMPVRSEERLNSKKNFPLIVAGGPCTVNPAPMAPFIDAFLIGDGEDAVVELVSAVSLWKLEGDGKKETLLREISKIEGFYVPSVHTQESRIKRRFITSLDDSPYPENLIVPYASIVHDRVNVEVARGCTMGCRFCQAGMIYRPLRERSPENVIGIAERSLKNTGYDELSFTALSAGDYSHLLPVIRECNRRFSGSRIAISLPSLRVAAVSQDVLREIRTIRKTGFTMAPEAATDRLRNVINKDFTEQDYEKALTSLFLEGWLTLKLYFMIGLPTEREEDIEAIREMVMKALHIAKKNTGKFVNISVTVSPFIPKSHTPFQWYGQIPFDEMRGKLRYLKETLSSKKFKYKGHNDEMSLLEAIFARGDEKLSPLIEKAWESGCRLDGWSEMFDFNKWSAAMDSTGIDVASYAEKQFARDEKLPWDVIDTGISKDFLYREYEKALSGEKTPNCNKACTACGLKCAGIPLGSSEERKFESAPACLPSAPPGSAKVRVRTMFSKTGRLRYLSHLELVTAILRGLRRAGVSFDFSKGFHPTPKVSLGPPLSVGVAGEKEYFDMEVFLPFNIEATSKDLNDTLPEGIRIIKMGIIPMNEPSLNSFITRYEYRIQASGNGPEYGIDLLNPISNIQYPVIVQREGKDVDISPCIEDVKIIEGPIAGTAGPYVKLILKDYGNIKVRIGEVAEALSGINMRELHITRTALYGWKDGWGEP